MQDLIFAISDGRRMKQPLSMPDWTFRHFLKLQNTVIPVFPEFLTIRKIADQSYKVWNVRLGSNTYRCILAWLF